ncbi:MAG: Gx transporter family protein [Clostridia bacterium]|nr:Gx transporter family protein [Clostridia bacterium]
MAKKISVYGLLTALCLVFGYLESLVSLSLIAPGIKLGLANGVALLLLAKKDWQGAFAVNLTRILLSTLLFGTPMQLLFSLSGGIGSLTVMAFLCRTEKFSLTGLSIAGGVVHNLFQLAAAVPLIGRGVLYYLPVLLVCGGISGGLIGFLATIIFKKIETNGKK